MHSSPDLRLPELPYRKTTLSNGLDVITLRTGLLPIVSVNLWYHVGSKNEERTQRGFAHLFEHLMFEGSEHYPGDYFKPLQRVGASVNGSTSADRTNYFCDLPSAHLELAVAMESDRMANLLPALTDEKVRVQKDVVKNEYRQNYANRPYGRVGRILAEAMYPPSHPYSWLTIGAMEDVERASREEIETFFHRFYIPANASLAVVGDIDEDHALNLASRYFGAIPGGTRALPVHVPDSASSGHVVIEIREPVELDRLYMSWSSVPQFHPRDAAMAMLADVLTRGRASRLYEDLVVARQICQDVSAHQSGREITGSFGVVATLRPGQDANAARDRIEGEIEAIAEAGVQPEELDRVKNSRLAGFVFALDNVGGFGGVSDRLNAYNVYLHDPGRITSDFQRYQSVTTEAIRDAARSLLGQSSAKDPKPRRVTLTVRGGKPRTTLPPLDRSIRPVASVASSFRAPQPVGRVLRSGVPLWVLPRRDLPIVAATIVVAAGASAHGAEKGGLASLTSNMMDEGTTSRTSHQIALESERLGTNLTSTSGWDGSYVSFQCLAPHLDRSLELALDVLLNPVFPEADFRRISEQTLAGLKSDRDSADSRAYRGFLQSVYPGGHPYAVPAGGDEATVRGISREDLLAFHRASYRPDRAGVVVAGDVDPDSVLEQLDAMLGDWAGTGRIAPDVSRPEPLARPRIRLLDRPGSPQAAVRIGHAGIARSDPDHDAVMLFNQILGGQFSSRLNAKLREEKGFTYGIRSQFDTRKGPGPFSISASLQANRIAEALQDIRDEVEAVLGDRPPNPVELDDARRALIEGQARHFETPSALVSRYAGLFLYNLPLDDHARLAERLEAVSTEQMLEAARRHLKPEAMTYVVVADAESVSSGLAGLSWGELEVLTADFPA